ncbi:MAG TPA: TraR/DksA C4-type zinc finger protein [Candidatus Saccharimonadales bacterium]|nr:TraR/DksA C4-type zinc finger protein [Candidatus Saccharimonadales bacterium]
MNTEIFEKILVEQKEKLSKQIIYLKKEDPYAKTDRETAVLDDTITEIEEHDRIFATAEELKKELIDVERALKRIEAGTYGICLSSGDKIEEERLKIMPTASLCLSCQKKVKRG